MKTDQIESEHGRAITLEHDLFRKPLSTFGDHALAREAPSLLGHRGGLVEAFARRRDRRTRFRGNRHSAGDGLRNVRLHVVGRELFRRRRDRRPDHCAGRGRDLCGAWRQDDDGLRAPCQHDFLPRHPDLWPGSFRRAKNRGRRNPAGARCGVLGHSPRRSAASSVRHRQARHADQVRAAARHGGLPECRGAASFSRAARECLRVRSNRAIHEGAVAVGLDKTAQRAPRCGHICRHVERAQARAESAANRGRHCGRFARSIISLVWSASAIILARSSPTETARRWGRRFSPI
jgi:hypothetical protein